VRFDAEDVLSGFLVDSHLTFAVATLRGEGQDLSVSETFRDLADNSRSVTVSGINIDRTAPITAATPTPPASGTGWWTSAVSVALAAADNLSGVSATEYKLDDGAWTAYATPVSVAGQGRHVLQYRSTDRADNQEAARTLDIGIDPSAPEVAIRFEPSTMDLAVVGRDDVSGLSAPISFTATEVVRTRDDEDREEEDGDDDDEDHQNTNHMTQDRTYRIADRSGNSLELVVRVKRDGREVEASVRSLRYNGGATLTPPGNELEFEWKLSSSGALKELEQEFAVGKGRTQQEVEATFNAARNSTMIEVERPAPERRVVRPGLALLRLATDRGGLSIEFD
jgi:hypothetical protein